MGKPAARVGDMHVCPMSTGPVPHVGGPVLPPGVPTVLIGGMPAATLGNMCTCTGPPDMIAMGSAGVFIGGKPAARMGDTCAHGGTIVIGCPTVLIGEAGGGGGAAMLTSSQIAGVEVGYALSQAITLKKAAEEGTPFCEECEKSKNDETKEEEPQLLECYYENEEGDIIEDLPDEGKVILVVKSTNMAGESVDIDLSDNAKDFKYNGSGIENDIIKGLSITSDEQKVELEVISAEEAEASDSNADQEGQSEEASAPVQQNHVPSDCDMNKVQEIKAKYENMISRSRSLGSNVAAANLEYFLEGSGVTKNLDVSWLRSFNSVTNAESRILGYTEKLNLDKWVITVKEGEVLERSDYWDADIVNYSPTSELSYASGASDMKGDVTMKLERTGDLVSAIGSVKIHWSDNYNWNNGMGFFIPGSGYIDDKDGIYMERCGGAQSFMMISDWEFNFNGQFYIKKSEWVNSNWEINGVSYSPNGSSNSSDRPSSR